MSVKIKSTKGIGKRGVKVCVYGKSDSGKTRLCATAPKPIILSSEQGLLSLKEQDIPYIDIETVADIYDALEFVIGKKGKEFSSICLDSSTDMAEKILADHLKNEKDPRKAYMHMAAEVKDLIWKFKDIRKKNLVVVAKRGMIEEPETGGDQYVPLMPGKALMAESFLPYQFDEVFYCTIQKNDEGKRKRVVLTSSGTEYEAKDRSGSLNRIEQPNLTKIFEKISNSKSKTKRRK